MLKRYQLLVSFCSKQNESRKYLRDKLQAALFVIFLAYTSHSIAPSVQCYLIVFTLQRGFKFNRPSRRNVHSESD